MYKLEIKNKEYNFYSVNKSNNYELVCKTKKIETLSNYLEKLLPESSGLVKQLLSTQIYEAVEFMLKNNHSTAEFGVRGYFTVSY